MDLFAPNSSYSPMRPPIFVGGDRALAYSIIITVSTVGLTLECLFLAGIRRLCGFEANYAFTLLAGIALCGVHHILVESTAATLAIIGLQWENNILLFRIIGELAFAPLFCLPYFHVLLAAHRVLVVAFPLSCKALHRPIIWKIALVLILIFYISFLVINQTNLAGITYVPRHMIFVALYLPYTYIFFDLNDFANYGILAISITVYPMLLIYLKFTSKMSGSRSRYEARMTIQLRIEGIRFDGIEQEGLQQNSIARFSLGKSIIRSCLLG
ncbi:hypothetical protein ANCCAN_21881 [Ancylostoma caninum]|uniref:7TM GPCR serpentine receptor class x (Srx) domain-containing protein n=1 Tax=Ancylostoma caninum TaxID=29170 RepID=A0A368FJ88_ANCCA|nr:hypothetical protein ANCCAN_21881 [Ancylostoma caninum]